jgi:hypothetical protein
MWSKLLSILVIKKLNKLVVELVHTFLILFKIILFYLTNIFYINYNLISPRSKLGYFELIIHNTN